ncbi:hypothetical protein E6C60_3378 [Paenibacillus algicola]|uniref:Uncharacterized protein n=1 Tax=Paenibacillus algicola TaxID=2565926 RepID=A0A4P8XTN3_9BACL|nr:hypothetical protein E6C60_3378 [Paenibacillus algicola]
MKSRMAQSPVNKIRTNTFSFCYLIQYVSPVNLYHIRAEKPDSTIKVQFHRI